jgi:hypothetical protein
MWHIINLDPMSVFKINCNAAIYKYWSGYTHLNRRTNFNSYYINEQLIYEANPHAFSNHVLITILLFYSRPYFSIIFMQYIDVLSTFVRVLFMLCILETHLSSV